MAYRLARSLEKLVSQVNALAPNRSKRSDGWIGDASHFATGSSSDHNPWIKRSGVGIVTAVDITHDPAHGCDVFEIAKSIAASRDRRLKYMIYTGGAGGRPGILSRTVSPWTWRVRASDDHPHHLHISANSDAASYDSTAAWSISSRSVSKQTSKPAVLVKDTEQIMADIILRNPLSKANASSASGLNSIWAYTVMNNTLLKAMAAKVGVTIDVDEKALAAELAPLLVPTLKANLTTLTDADMIAIATSVADEQARRQTA